jgi:putative transposase
MCKLLKVSSSGYYQWLRRPLSPRAVSNMVLDQEIIRLFKEHKSRCGYRGIHKHLLIDASSSRVRRRMKVLGLQAIHKRKYNKKTKQDNDYTYADNLLNQDFHADHLDQKWVSDITEIKNNNRKLYLAVVLDLCSRKVIGWSMSNRMTASIVCNALNMAMRNRAYPTGVIIHSDRGSQYCSNDYQALINQYQLKCSMSAKGCCYDNASCESFFATLKAELICRETFTSLEQAKSAIFEYIEAYYNRVRLHSGIDYLSPVIFEQQLLAIAA